MGQLTEIIEEGKPITPDDIKSHTIGLTPGQVHAIQEKCETLNGLD